MSVRAEIKKNYDIIGDFILEGRYLENPHGSEYVDARSNLGELLTKKYGSEGVAEKKIFEFEKKRFKKRRKIEMKEAEERVKDLKLTYKGPGNLERKDYRMALEKISLRNLKSALINARKYHYHSIINDYNFDKDLANAGKFKKLLEHVSDFGKKHTDEVLEAKMGPETQSSGEKVRQTERLESWDSSVDVIIC